jgi:predicted permease
MNQLMQDIRYAARQLRRSPGFTASILLVLGLGIGANAAIFSILNVTLLRRLPFERPGQLVTLQGTDGKGGPAFAAYLDTVEWQRQAHTVSSIAFYDPGQAYLDGQGGLRRVSSTAVSTNLFSTLGVAPAMGRTFTAEEQQAGKGDVAILSDGLWKSRFQDDPAILGRAVSLDGVPTTVVGVMPKGFAFPQGDTEQQVWRPEQVNAAMMLRESMTSPDNIIARTKPGVQPGQAAADLSAVQKRLQALYTGNWAMMAASAVSVTPYRVSLDKDHRPALLALIAAVVLIWLIACANAANLMLARSSARRREIAVRGALGAGRARIVRQLLTESFLLAIGSAAIGIGLGALTLRVFSHVLLTQLHLSQPPGFDLPVLGALLALTFVSTLLFGLAPALLATNTPIEQALRQDGAHSGSSRSHHRIQRTLVVTEIAMSLTLLVACGLLLRTVYALHKVPLGFRTDHVLLVEPSIPGYKYKQTDVAQTLYLPLVDKLRAMHGVEAAALTTVAPLEQKFDMTMQFMMWKNGAKEGTHGATVQINSKMRASTDDLQKVFGFRVKEGRYFNAQDTASSAPVALVNDAFERQYKAFQGQSAIGHFSLYLSGNRGAKVVGVIEDFRQAGVDKPAEPEIELLASQLHPGDDFYQATLQSHVELAVRTRQTSEQFIPDLRRVLGDANPDLRSATITTMDQIVEDSLGPQLLAAHLLETLAGLALLVALAGLYSLLAYLVTLRTRELGLRIALGADRNNILGLVLSQAAWLVVLGVAIGTVASLATAHLIEHFLFGVKPRDVATLVASAATMLIVGLLASWLPARRASRTNPMEALRTE